MSGADLGFPTAVVSVAGFAFLAEQVVTGRDLGLIVRQRVDARLRFRGDTPVEKPGCDIRLDRPRFLASARQTGQEPLVQGADTRDYHDNGDKRDDEYAITHGSLRQTCNAAVVTKARANDRIIRLA